MRLILITLLIIVASSTISYQQERIDDWYGKEFTELHAALQHDHANYGNKFKYKDHGNDKRSLTMTDYRGVEVDYISLDGGYTVSYRVDHYTKKEYVNRVDFIKRKWNKLGRYYVLRSTVVAMFDDKQHTIGFTLLSDLRDNNFDPQVERINGYKVINK